jgi:hypothetical protein
MRRMDRERSRGKSALELKNQQLAQLNGKYRAALLAKREALLEADPVHLSAVLKKIGSLARRAAAEPTCEAAFAPGLGVIADVTADLRMLLPPFINKQMAARRATVTAEKHARARDALNPADHVLAIYLALDDCYPYSGWTRSELKRVLAGMEPPPEMDFAMLVGLVRSTAGRWLRRSTTDAQIAAAVSVFARPLLGAGRPSAAQQRSHRRKPEVPVVATELERAAAVARLLGHKTKPIDMARIIREAKTQRAERAKSLR